MSALRRAHLPRHDEACRKRPTWVAIRHEAVKLAVGQALGTVPGASVHLEPMIHGHSRRNDVCIEAAFGNGDITLEDYDVAVLLLSGVTARYMKLTDEEIARYKGIDAALQLADKILDTTHGSKVTNPPDREGCHVTLQPSVLSTGVFPLAKTAAKMAKWRKWMGSGAYDYDYMIRRIAISLVKVRGSTFEHGTSLTIIQPDGDRQPRPQNQGRGVTGAGMQEAAQDDGEFWAAVPSARVGMRREMREAAREARRATGAREGPHEMEEVSQTGKEESEAD